MKLRALVSPLCAVVLVLAHAVFPPSGGAQQSGQTATVSHPADFLVSKPLTFDPAPRVGSAVRKGISIPIKCGTQGCVANIGDDVGFDFIQGIVEDLLGISIPDEIFDALDLVSPDINFTPGPTGNLEAYFQVNSTAGGHLTARYPVDFVLTYPAPNSFACGDPIAIGMTAAVRPDSTMAVEPSLHETVLGGGLSNLRFEASFDACFDLLVDDVCLSDVVDLPSYKSAPFNATTDFVNICDAAFQPGGDVTSCGAANAVFGWERLFLGSDGSTVSFRPTIPKAPEMAATFLRPREGDLQLTRANANRNLTRAGTKQATSDFDIDLVSFADYVCTSCPPGINPTRITIPGVFGVDLGDLNLSYIADHEMRFDLTPQFSVQLECPAGDACATVAGLQTTMAENQPLQLSYPQALSDPVLIRPTYRASAALTALTRQKYFVGGEFNLLQLKVGDINTTVIHHDLPRAEVGSPETIENHTQQVSDFNAVTLTPITLDPENPIVAVTHHQIQDVVNLGGGERAVVYRVGVQNQGDVALSSADLELDLAETFSTAGAFTAVCTVSPELTVNEQFDGRTETNLLAPGTTLQPGEQGTVDVLVRVRPALSVRTVDGCFAPVVYSSSSQAEGTSPIGTDVRNNFNQCTGVATGADIIGTADLGASQITSVADYAVFGQKGVTLDRMQPTANGNVGAGEQVHVKGKKQGPTALTIIGDVHAGRHLHVQDITLTADYVHAGEKLLVNPDKDAALVTTGGLSAPSACPTVFELPALDVADISRAAPRVQARTGDSVAVAPGDYLLLEAAANAILRLRAGTYNVADVKLTGANATLAFDTTDGPVVLNVQKWSSKPLPVGLVVSAGSSRDVQINVEDGSAIKFTGALVQGNLLAPRAHVDFDEGSVLQGTVHAEHVTFGPGSRFSHHKFQEPLAIDPSCLPKLTR